ncbi:sensor histidine kinase [Deinococcus cellulosilyticus]|nr:sensor histidine kinase [Deinococcus cellulosilyticus]
MAVSTPLSVVRQLLLFTFVVSALFRTAYAVRYMHILPALELTVDALVVGGILLFFHALSRNRLLVATLALLAQFAAVLLIAQVSAALLAPAVITGGIILQLRFLLPLQVVLPLGWLLAVPISMHSVMVGVRAPVELGLWQWWVVWSVAFTLSLLAADALIREAQAREELALAHEQLSAYLPVVAQHARLQERTRLARDMHDAVGHQLVALQMRLSLCDTLFDDHLEQARTELQKARDLTREVLSETRRAVTALRPLAVEEKGLVNALHDLQQQLPTLRLHVKVQGQEKQSTEAEQDLAYRLVQEALTNTSKHAAQAQNAYIELVWLDGGMRLQVEDDGSCPEQLQFGFGLQHLQRRVLEMDGTFQAGRGVRGGFQVQALIPFQEVPL